MKALAFVSSVPWAIRESALQTILNIAARQTDESIQAVEARLGRKLDNTRTVTNRDGISLIPVAGPIFRYANLFDEVSGGTSVQVLAKDFTTALEEPSVKSILFVIDSPGGQVDGIHELANMIYEARGRKPIQAYVDGYACSAAYWIASATSRITVDATASLGSIGVVAVVPDPSKRPKDLQIVSAQSPNKRLDPESEAGRSAIQKQVDTLAEVFIQRVARNRGVAENTVTGQYGAGDVKVGAQAVKSGLADRLGSLEGVISELKRGLGVAGAPAPRTAGRPASAARAGRLQSSGVEVPCWADFEAMGKDRGAKERIEDATLRFLAVSPQFKKRRSDVHGAMESLRGQAFLHAHPVPASMPGDDLTNQYVAAHVAAHGSTFGDALRWFCREVNARAAG